MQLSDTDKKMVSRLRKEQQFIIRLRWVRLFVAIGGLAACVYCGFTLVEVALPDPDPFSMFLLALISPFICLIFFGDTFFIVYILRYWNGKPETNLLLRVIDDLQKHDA